MKATGIVRRIDDLGRVVIPKEIRRTMRIREGDPLEIYTNSEGEVIFKKYSAMSELSENAANVAEVMYKTAGCPVVVFDKDHARICGAPRDCTAGGAHGQPRAVLLSRRSQQQLLPCRGRGAHGYRGCADNHGGRCFGSCSLYDVGKGRGGNRPAKEPNHGGGAVPRQADRIKNSPEAVSSGLVFVLFHAGSQCAPSIQALYA